MQRFPKYSILDSLKTKMSQHYSVVTSRIGCTVCEGLYANEYFFDPIYLVATFIDSRYHLLLEDDLLEAAKRELKCMISMNENTTSASQEAASSQITPIRSQSSSNNPLDILAMVHVKINEKRSSESFTSPVGASNQEITAFLNEMKALDSMDDPFVFWMKKAALYPRIYNVAVDVLCIPATSAPCKRVFSRTSFALAKNRHNLSDESLESEIFFKFNMEFLM